MHRGYFALWRKVEDHPFYKEPREFSKLEAWIDILLNAQHEMEPQDVLIGLKILKCHYGECLKSNVTWAKRWFWSESKVRRFIKLLENMSQIRTKSEGVTTRISIINYEHYDPKRRANDETATRLRRDCDETATTDNNDKNDKNEKNGFNVPNGTFVNDNPEPTCKPPRCPHQKIIDLYHKHLPHMTNIQVWDNTSKTMLSTRWREDTSRQCLEWWDEFFQYIAKSDFLNGRVKDFVADLHWIVRPTNFAKIVNGKYHNKRSFHDKLKEIGERWLQNEEKRQCS
jgi:hypothetical protein